MSLPCIPGIYGFGTDTRHAWGGPIAPQLLRVTTLNDSGAGSFRAAVEATIPRIVVFEISGACTLLSDLKITNPYLHIAGQTAPTPGFAVFGRGLQLESHDLLFEHFRIRPGWTGANCNDPFGAYHGDAYNLVASCMSISWGQDENVYAIRPERPLNFTFWRSITSENLHQTPGSGGCTGTPEISHGFLIYDHTQAVAIIQSLFAHNVTRNPYLQNGTSALLLENVVFDWYKEWGFFGGIHSNFVPAPWIATVVGQRFIRGPNTVNPSDGDAAWMFFYRDNEGVNQSGVKIYRLDNTLTNDPDNKVIEQSWDTYDPNVAVPPIAYAGYTRLVTSSTLLEAALLPLVGARPTDRDSVDARIISEVGARTGSFIATQNDVGGYPALTVNRRSLTPPDNFNDVMDTGYTRGEMWLFGFSVGVGDTTTTGGSVSSIPTIVTTGGTTDPGGGVTPPSGTQGTPPTEGTGSGNVGAGAPIVVGVSVSGVTPQGTRRLLVSGASFPTDLTLNDISVTRDGTPTAVSSIESNTSTLITLVLAADFLGGSHTYCVNIGTAANRQLLFGRTHRFSGGLDYTFSPFTFGGATSNIAPLTDVDVRQPMSVAGTFRLLKVTTDVRAPSGKSWQIVCLKNGVAQALAVSITDSTDVDPAGSYTVRDIANSVHVAVGDTISFEYRRIPTSSGTVNPGVMDFAIEFDADTTGTSMYGFTSTLLGTGSVSYFPLLNGRAGNLTSGLQVSVIPGSCNVVRFDLRQTAGAGSGGSGKSYTYLIRKNGVDQDGTAGTPDTRVTLLETATTGSLTGSFSMVAGDYLELKVTPNGTPASVKVGVGVAIASSDGSNKYILPGCNLTTVGGATAAKYLSISSTDNVNDTWNVTESNQAVHAGIAGVNLLGLTARPSASPGGGAKTITLTFRKNFADASPALSLVFNVAGSLSATPASAITLADGDLAAVQETPSGTPTTVTLSWAFIAQYAAASICVNVLTPSALDDLPDLSDPCLITKPERFQVIKAIHTPAVVDPTYDLIFAADVPMRDTGWYGNWKPQRMMARRSTRRIASDFATGAFPAQTGGATWADPDGEVHQFVYDHGLTLVGAEVFDYLVDYTSRKAGGVPRLQFRGLVSDDTIDEERKYTFQFTDTIGSGYSVLTSDLMIPQRAVNTDFNVFGLTGTDTLSVGTLGAQIIIGKNSDQSEATPRGMVPVIPVGDATCADGVVRWVGLVAGHACQGGVQGVYSGDDPPASPNWGVNGFAPGLPGWAGVNTDGPALYTNVNGRWYTLIALNKGTTLGDGFASGKTKLWANVNGLEDVGDGTGTLMENLHRLYLHLLINFFLQDWQSGPWLSVPTISTYADSSSGVTISQIDSDSFYIAATTAESLVPITGFVAAGVIGANGQQQALRSVLAQLNVQCLGMLAMNQYNQYTFRTLNRDRAAFVNVDKARDDRFNTLQSKPFTAKFQRDLLANHFRAGCALNLRTGKWGSLGELEDGISVSRHQLRLPQAEGYSLITSVATATALANERMRFRSTGRRLFSWRESLCGLGLSVLDAIPFSHFNLDGTGGRTSTTVWITSVTDNGDDTVDIEAIEVEDLMTDPVTHPEGSVGPLGSQVLETYLSIVPGAFTL